MKRFIFTHQPSSSLLSIVLAGAGGGLAIAGLSWLSSLTAMSWLAAPFGASCVLLFVAPGASYSQPVNVIGGHLVSAAIGIALAVYLPGQFQFWGVAMAVGLAISAMMILRMVHPPAGATAMVTYLAAAKWMFLLFPIAAGAVALVIFAAIYHRLTGGSYPTATAKN